MKQNNNSQIIYTDEAAVLNGTASKNNENKFKANITEFVNKHAEIWKFIKFTFTGASTSVLGDFFTLYFEKLFAMLDLNPCEVRFLRMCGYHFWVVNLCKAYVFLFHFSSYRLRCRLYYEQKTYI